MSEVFRGLTELGATIIGAQFLTAVTLSNGGGTTGRVVGLCGQKR